MAGPVTKFRGPGNQRYLKALFWEEVGEDKSTVHYTLKDWDHEGYPSLYRLYMESNDPTEYKFATEHLESWDHWTMLCECNWFKPFINRWRKELEVRMKSNALAKIMAEAKAGGKEQFSANKYLLEKGWEPKDSLGKRGRPSKEEIKKAAEEAFTTNSRISDDFDRVIGLKN
jgi:hypothetical protein